MAIKHTIEECPQRGTIAVIEKSVTLLEHTLNGNGQEGVAKTVTRLDGRVKNMEVNLEELKKGQQEILVKVSEVFEYRVAQEAVSKEKTVRSVHLKWLIGIIIALLLGVAGLVVDIKLQKNKELTGTTINETGS